MVKRLLELFSGTHSIGKEAHKKGYEVYSLDKDLGAGCPFGTEYKSYKHFQEDILTWNYKQYPKGYFHLITASPVCLWWSPLQRTWIGRKRKGMDRPFTAQDIQDNINKYGKPMVDKVREIINYFEPKYYCIENPATGSMKKYITDLPFHIVDYCKYAPEWGYKKSTILWTNIKIKPKICKKDCKAMYITKTQAIHKCRMGTSKTVIDNGKIIRCNTKELRNKYKNYKNITSTHDKMTKKYERYRIPPLLINDILNNC